MGEGIDEDRLVALAEDDAMRETPEEQALDPTRPATPGRDARGTTTC
jgi:hypothetical protein